MPASPVGLDRFQLSRVPVIEVLRLTCATMQEFNRVFMKPYEVRLSNKNVSEILGKVLESHAASVFTQLVGYEVRKERSDRDPDLFFTGIGLPLEVKVTSTATGWTGGEFSKRPFDYLLISWDPNSLYDRYFAALVHLEKEDWVSRMANDYYGPSFSAKRLSEKRERREFVGRIGQGKHHGIHLLWEDVISDATPQRQIRSD